MKFFTIFSTNFLQLACNLVWKMPTKIQGDSKRWTQFRTSIFAELYMVREWST